MKSERVLASHLVRLEKVVAELGIASRREAKQLIADGKISVNGVIVREPGFGVNKEKDGVQLVGSIDSKKTVLVYKPRGVETTKTSLANQDIHDLFPFLRNLAPVGRLDKDSQGLILLTNDGLITRALTRQGSLVDKEYFVVVREQVPDEAVLSMAQGIVLDGKKTLPATVKKIDNHSFSIVLHEGRKHQIRRMADACRLTIESLERIRIGELSLELLNGNEYCELDADMTKKLKRE